jgi:hypothetical protein
MKWFESGAFCAIKRRLAVLLLAAATVAGAPLPSANAFAIYFPGVYFGHRHHYGHYGYHHHYRHYGYHHHYRHYGNGHSHHHYAHHGHGGSSHVSGGGGGHLPGAAE